MARYVDGFVIPIPRKNVAYYRKMAKKAGEIWKEHGALEYLECEAEDLTVKGGMTSFRKCARAKPSETVYFSWIVYPSKTARNRINRKVLNDPRIHAMMENQRMPFDVKRMVFGGFKAVVDL